MIFKMGYFIFISSLNGLDETRINSQSDKSGYFYKLEQIQQVK